MSTETPNTSGYSKEMVEIMLKLQRIDSRLDSVISVHENKLAGINKEISDAKKEIDDLKKRVTDIEKEKNTRKGQLSVLIGVFSLVFSVLSAIVVRYFTK